MRIAAVFVSVLVAAGLVAGCKADPKPAASPAAGSAAAGGGSGSAGGGGSAASSAQGSAAAGDGSGGGIGPGEALALPKGTGAPPKKTAKKLEPADFARLAALEFPGFKRDVREQDKGLEVRHSTPRPVIATTVTVMPCFDCIPMELEAWKAREASLKLLLAPELRDRPDTVWEMGKGELNGAPVIYTYQFGHFFGKDDMGNPVGAFSNAYVLYLADGNNQIRVVTEYKDDPAAREDILAIAPREDLEKVARAFLDAYTQAW